MWVPPSSSQSLPSTQSTARPLEVNQYDKDRALKKRAYVKIEEWEPHKEFVLRQRHMKVKEKDILFALRHERGFMVEMHQLKKVLQLWNSKRNLKRRQRDYIVQVVKERRRAGKTQTIFYHPSGTLIDLPEVKEIMRRYGNTEPLEPPSPGGLIYGSPRLRTAAPELLSQEGREISPNDSDPYTISLDTTSPESLGSLASPMPLVTTAAAADFGNPTVSHMDIDRFLLQQTTGQSYPNVAVPTTMGYQGPSPGGSIYPPFGFVPEEYPMPSGYNRPIPPPEIEHLFEPTLPRPTLPSLPSSSVPTGFFPEPQGVNLFNPQPSGAAAPSIMQYPPSGQPIPLPAPIPAPQRQQSPSRFVTSNPSIPAGRSKSFLTRLGFPSKRSGAPPPPPPPAAAAPQMYAPGSLAPNPVPQAAQFYADDGIPLGYGGPPQTSASSSTGSWGEEDAERKHILSRRSRKVVRKETTIKDEVMDIDPQLMTLDDSSTRRRKKQPEDKAQRYQEIAERADRLLSGMPPREDEASRRARKRVEEEIARRKIEEANARRAAAEYARMAAELEQARVAEAIAIQARIRAEAEADRLVQSGDYIRPADRPSLSEIDAEGEEEWNSGAEVADSWKEEPGDIVRWVDEPEEDWREAPQEGEWLEEEDDNWEEPQPAQRADPDEERLKETYERLQGFIQPRNRAVIVISLAKEEPEDDAYTDRSGTLDTRVEREVRIKLEEITNQEEGDFVGAMERLRMSDEKETREIEEKPADVLADIPLEKLSLADNSRNENPVAETPVSVSKKTLAIEIEMGEFQDVEFASQEMEDIYKAQLLYWIRNKMERAAFDVIAKAARDAEEQESQKRKKKRKKSKKFAEDSLSNVGSLSLPRHISHAIKEQARVGLREDATQEEIQTDRKLWNWVLKRYNIFMSYMKETADDHWTTHWRSAEQAAIYFLPFLKQRFGLNHFYTLEAISLLGQSSFFWEERTRHGWKDSMRLRNMAYSRFADLGMKEASVAFACLDDGFTDSEGKSAVRRRMELRRAVEYYRIIRKEFGNRSLIGAYAIGKLMRALAKVDQERTQKVILTAAVGILNAQKEMWEEEEILAAVEMIGGAMMEVGMAKEGVWFLWAALPKILRRPIDKAKKSIKGSKKKEYTRELLYTKKSLPAVRILGHIANGFQELRMFEKATDVRRVVLGFYEIVLGYGHPDTLRTAENYSRGVEAAGLRVIMEPRRTLAQGIVGMVFWEGQRRGTDRRRLLRFMRRTAKQLQISG